jgi:hypothetical protein
MYGCVSKSLEVASAEDLERLGRVLAREADDRSQAVTRSHALELVASPIHFTGRVVSPDGSGIADASVEFAVFDRVIEPFHFPYFGYTTLRVVQSDPEGYFELHDMQGVALHVTVSKAGYRPVDLSHRTYQTEHVLPVAEDFPMPEPQEVALFTLKPRTAADQLREVTTGAVLIPEKGSVGISLTEINPRLGFASGQGDLQLECDRGNLNLSRYAWTCRVRVPGGGVQLRNLVDFDFAPGSGYQPYVELGFQEDAPEWRDRIDEDVFLQLANGNYAFLTLKIRTRGDYYAIVNGVLNEQGSRLID